MDGIQMEPVGRYKADRNGSAKAAWRNMVDQDLDDVAFLADTDKAREAREAAETPIAVCSQRRAVCITACVFAAIFAIALIFVYASPQPDCPCALDSSTATGSSTTESDTASVNKERISTSGVVFPWRGARLPTFIIPKHYSLWLHPNLTTGELRGEVSIDFKVDRDTMFLVLNVRDMNVTERALFKTGGSLGPKVAKTLEYPQADQSYIEFKDKLRRKYNYTLSLRFITKLERDDSKRGFFLTGSPRHRCAVSRLWLTHARSVFPCLDEPHLRATFQLTMVRDRFHVSLTNMPIVATEEAGFYLGHRLLQDEFATSPPMPPHMVAMAVCRLQRRSIPRAAGSDSPNEVDSGVDSDSDRPPEVSLYADQQALLDDGLPLMQWVQNTLQAFSYELNTSYPLPKLDILVVEGANSYSEGWGLITISPTTLSDYKTIARLLAQQWFGGLVSPRWWSSQWLMEALTSVLAEKAPPFGQKEISSEIQQDTLLLDHILPALRSLVSPRWWSSQWLMEARTQQETLLLDHILPALRLDASSSVRPVASPRLERADIEAADELSLHKGAAIVSMAIEAAGEQAGREALARLLREHKSASADARDLWRSLQYSHNTSAVWHTWDAWCERAGHPLLAARRRRPRLHLAQTRFVMQADPPDPEPQIVNALLTHDLRAELDELFYEPDNFTEIFEEDENSTTTTTTPVPTTKKPIVRTTKAPPAPKWTIPVTFTVGPLEPEYEEEVQNITRLWKNTTESVQNGTSWYELGNDTKVNKGSRWAQNVTHLVWMNDTEMVIEDLGKHKWVRFNVGARGLYRVAPQEDEGQTPESAASLAATLYESGSPAERALLLDDAFVLSRANRLPTSAAIAIAAYLRKETHWAPWRVVVTHLTTWRELLRFSNVAERFFKFVSELEPEDFSLVEGRKPGQPNWLSGALLTAGVEWENERITNKAADIFNRWYKNNETIPEIYQEAAFTAGVRRYGLSAWHAAWSALADSYRAPRPAHSRRALLAALAATPREHALYKFAYTVLSSEAQRSPDWKMWVTTLFSCVCKWRGAPAVWRLLSSAPALPPAALQAAARCLHQPLDYYRFKELFGDYRGVVSALDTIALNAAWVPRAESELTRYFDSLEKEAP